MQGKTILIAGARVAYFRRLMADGRFGKYCGGYYIHRW